MHGHRRELKDDSAGFSGRSRCLGEKTVLYFGKAGGRASERAGGRFEARRSKARRGKALLGVVLVDSIGLLLNGEYAIAMSLLVKFIFACGDGVFALNCCFQLLVGCVPLCVFFFLILFLTCCSCVAAR